MDTNTQNSSGMMNGMPPTPRTEKKVGPIAGVLIIVLVLVIAALYFFGQKLNTESVPATTVPAATKETSMNTPTTNASQSMTATASQPDDVASLQADLNSQLQDVDYSF